MAGKSRRTKKAKGRLCDCAVPAARHILNRGKTKFDFDAGELGMIRLQASMFVQEYLVDFNPTKAAERVGVPASLAELRGNAWLKDGRVVTAIEKAINERLRRLKFNADNVINELARIAFSDVRSLYDRTTRKLKSPLDLDDDIAACVESIQYDATKTGRVYIKQVKLHSKMDALKQLLQHFGMEGTKKVQVDVNGNIEHTHQVDPAILENTDGVTLARLLQVMGHKIALPTDIVSEGFPLPNNENVVIDLGPAYKKDYDAD